MRIGVVRYPGSNCFNDTIRYFGKESCIELWYETEEVIQGIDLLIIPGGFAFGDRYYEKATDSFNYSPGRMAKDSLITNTILYCYENKIPILGICNGFQILTHLKLLPGELKENESKLFHSKRVKCNYDCDDIKGDTELYIANYYGNYQYDEIDEKNVFLKYSEWNNGSINGIAGITNEERTVFGMMPHPERNSNFKDILLKLIYNKEFINHKINRIRTYLIQKYEEIFIGNLYRRRTCRSRSR